MATTRIVHPVRLVLDATRLGDPANLDLALDAALARSVGASSSRLPPAPGTVNVHVPPMQWLVPGTLEVSQADQQRVEASVHAAIRRAAPAPVSPAAVSPVAASRQPSRSVVEDDVDFEVSGYASAMDFVPLSEAQVKPACVSIARQVPGGPPQDGQVGVIYQRADDGGLEVGAVSFPGANLVHFPIGQLHGVNLDPNASTWVTIDANSSFVLSWEAPGDDPVAVLTRFTGGILKAKAKAARPHTDTDGLGDAEYEAAIDRLVANRITQLAEPLKGSALFLRITVDDSSFLLAAGAEIRADWLVPGFSLVLYPVASPTGLPLTERYGTAPGSGQGGETEQAGKEPAAGEAAGSSEADGASAGTGSSAGEGGAGDGAAAGGAPATSEAADGTAGQPTATAAVRLESPTHGTMLFPPGPPGGLSPGQTCTAFEGEPSLEELGADGAPLKAMMEQIAIDLAMEPCGFLGAFMIDTGTFIAARALQVGSATWLSTGRPEAPPKAVQANLGDLYFVPSASPQIQLMRHLAGVVPRLRRLSDAYRQVLEARPDLIHGAWKNHFISWDNRFRYETNDSVGYGVGQLFGYTSSVLFGELLRTSARTIDAAITALPQTAPVFETRVLPMLSRIDDLTRWRDRLRAFRLSVALGQRADAPAASVPAAAGSVGPAGDAEAKRRAWRAAADKAAQTLSTAPTDGTRTPDGEEIGQVVRTPDGLRIRDDAGHLSVEEDLEQRIVLTRGAAEEVEPLVKHIDDLPEVVARMRAGGTAGVERELRKLLERMKGHNQEITQEADDDPWYGFGKSAIREDIPHATVPYSSYALGGVHLLAHQEIGEFFRGDYFYPLGINRLFDSELGRRALSGAAIFVGLVLISVVCPPAGIVLGAELAVFQLAKAYDKKDVYDALINPELVLTRAEVEMELFAAWFGAVLAFLPVGAKALGVLGKAARVAVALEGETAAGGRLAVAAAADEAGAASALEGAGVGARAEFVAEAQQELFAHFVVELVKAKVINDAVEAIMTPIMRQLQHELESTAAVGGMKHAVAIVLGRQLEEDR
jgi:hypothetical protein